jgi:hypothetical protein
MEKSLFRSLISRERAFVLGISILILTVGSLSVLEKSETFDETMYMGFGHYYMKTRDKNMIQLFSHPPLSYYINSMPFLAYKWAGILDLPVEAEKCVRCYDKKYFYPYVYSDRYKGFHLLFYSRCAMLSTLLLLSAYFFRLTRRLFGFKVSCALTALLAFNPNVLAHARLITPDMTTVCLNFISFYYFIEFVEEKRILTAVKFGLSAGLALLANTVNAYLMPFYAGVLILDHIRLASWRKTSPEKTSAGNIKILAYYLIAVIVVLQVLSAGYLFEDTETDNQTLYRILRQIPYLDRDHWLTDSVLDYVSDNKYIRVPVPKLFLSQLLITIRHQERGHDSFFMGDVIKDYKGYSGFGIGYWLTAFLIKMPEGILALTIVSLAYHANKYVRKRRFEERLLVRVYLLSALTLACLSVILHSIRVNMGIRHMLIVFPYLYLFFGEPLGSLLENKRWSAFGWAIVALSLLPTAYYFPHYIAYFNQLIGGPENGYRYLSDSNIDWGQDLPGLKRWMDEHNISKIKLAYFGRARIEEHGINYISLPDNQKYLSTQRKAEVECGPTTSVLAISVTSLTGQYGNPHCYDWLKDFKPIDSIGYSILIYNITEEDLRNAA